MRLWRRLRSHYPAPFPPSFLHNLAQPHTHTLTNKHNTPSQTNKETRMPTTEQYAPTEHAHARARRTCSTPCAASTPPGPPAPIRLLLRRTYSWCSTLLLRRSSCLELRLALRCTPPPVPSGREDRPARACAGSQGQRGRCAEWWGPGMPMLLPL